MSELRCNTRILFIYMFFEFMLIYFNYLFKISDLIIATFKNHADLLEYAILKIKSLVLLLEL